MRESVTLAICAMDGMLPNKAQLASAARVGNGNADLIFMGMSACTQEDFQYSN
jgi:hypothetical protein